MSAAAEIAAAWTEGATLGSETLSFEPGRVRAGNYHFAIGTAGSTGLVLQTVLVPLLDAEGESQVVIEGGTHNEGAPPFEFLDLGFAPLLRRMGADLSLSLERPGFYPAGGGRIRARVGNATWRCLELLERGATRSLWARALVSRLPLAIADRELAVVKEELAWPDECLTASAIDSDGPGNALILVAESEHVTEVFTGFGRRGLPAEEVASQTVAKIRRYLDSGAAVGRHLADQLLVPMTQSKGGSFLTVEPSTHFTTNAGVIDRFFDLEISTRHTGENVNVVIDWRV